MITFCTFAFVIVYKIQHVCLDYVYRNYVSRNTFVKGDFFESVSDMLGLL